MRRNQILTWVSMAVLCSQAAVGTADKQLTFEAGDEEPERPVTLTTARTDYLLGQPVQLRVQFKNLTKQDLTVREYATETFEPEIAIFVSRDNKSFERFRFGYAIASVTPSWRTLRPGETCDYDFKVLFSRLDGGKLAFPQPGEYFLKAVYPLRLRGKNASKKIESNVITVKVTAPHGGDAQVWDRMNRLDMFDLIQSGKGAKEVALKVAELVREFPKSAYRQTLWHGLREFYYKQNYRIRSEGELIRQALGIKEIEFIDDPRLDLMLRGIDDEPISVEDLVVAISQQTGMELEVSAQLKGKRVRLSGAYVRLRPTLVAVSHQLRAPWWPQDKGYLLSKEPPDAGNPRK